MKYILVGMSIVFAGAAYAAGEKKEVCTDKKDNKGNIVKKADGTPVKECRTITVHKKVEGQKVPDKK